MIDNKKLGTAFERRMCRVLSNLGFWVHFITPDARGAQPFDIIAVKDQRAVAIECKTIAKGKRAFPYDRLEDNQKCAFEFWVKCGNIMPIIAVEQEGRIYGVTYSRLKEEKSVKLEEMSECGCLLQELWQGQLQE